MRNSLQQPFVLGDEKTAHDCSLFLRENWRIFGTLILHHAFMQPGQKKLLRFLQSWLVNTLAVLVTVIILHNHINYGGKLENLLIASFSLGILNAFIRPILVVFALPLLILTLGLFMLVINALMLCFLTVLLPFFHVDSFGYAFLGALIISLISGALNILTGNSNARISIQRRPPKKKPGDDGNGPVIDV